MKSKPVEETTITQAGVYRCCLGSVAIEYLGKKVEPGTESTCEYCGEEFRLQEDWVWVPVWQLADQKLV